MPGTKFYPPITEIVPVDALPNELGFVKSGLTNALSRIYFKDLQYSHNDRGDSAFYSLRIITLDRLDIEIPGTGLALILNPAHDASAGFSEFPVRLSYRWPILAYLRQFNLDAFSFLPADIFDLALRVTGITERQIVERSLQLFVSTPSPIDTFVDDLNAAFGTTIAHPAPASTDPLGDVLDEIDTTAGINGAGGAVFLLYLFDAASEDSTRERIAGFFNDLLNGIDVETYIRQLITPKIEASLEVGLAIEFPRNVLEPLDAVGGEPLEDDMQKTWLTFEAGSFYYSTERGIGFDQVLQAALNHPSRIAGTGFGISLDTATLDISRTTNIPQADADGRPVDFVGVYINDATISFPASWNQEAGSTGVIHGNNLLIGTGGISGTLALEAVAAGTAGPLVKFRFGEDFSVSLDRFSVTFKQNAITGSTIEGTLAIPGFKDANDDPAEIRIKVSILKNGDFDITAHEDDGFKPIRLPGVFDLELESVFFGKKDDDFYLGVSGSITFTHDLLKSVIRDPIGIEKLIIWSDGRYEIEGGTIPLPDNVRFPIGPAELSVSAIHLGSHQRPNGDTFRYFGFDAALDMNPGGLDVRGKGIKFFYPANGTLTQIKNDSYLEIKSLAIDLVIPGSASKETATLLISGFLSVGGAAGDPEYSGGVTFGLPKMKLSGGAAMKYRPKVPAFIVDAFVELSTPIPLGATSLGIFGFRGLFGQRYIATKTAGGVQETDTWFDYYKNKKSPPGTEGINPEKFEGPGQTAGYESTFSIGAGVSLATAADSGKAFSSKLFLLLSLPDLIYLEGRANIVGERVGLTGDDPPFFAVLAISPQSVELGAGVNYLLPRDGTSKGQILDLKAEMRAAFFFRNSSAWYVNIGTVEKPTTARILSLFDATSYLMISASGIAAGAGVSWAFDKSYAGGLVRASVGVYIKVGGFISFARPQIGGFAMLGGHVDVSFMGLGFYIGIDTSLMVEVPRPFYITGKVHLCVGITIGFWKFKKRIERCFDVEFRWEKEKNANLDPILPMADLSLPGALPPAGATNMLSGETFPVAAFGSAAPAATDSKFNSAVLPLDTWVDLEFLKGLLPNSAVDARIGRLSGGAPGNVEAIPPAEVAHKVTHQYSINALEIRAWSGTSWVDYRPYQAMSPPAALAVLAANPADYKDGYWTNTGGGGGLNKVRFLAETSLSYMQQPGWYVPEEMGITSATLFCRTKIRDAHCLDWTSDAAGTIYADGKWQQRNTALYRIAGGNGTVAKWTGLDGPQNSLAFLNDDVAEVVFNKPCAKVRVRLTTFSSGATITFYRRETTATATFQYIAIETRTLTQLQVLAPVHYDRPDAPVAKIVIAPVHADSPTVEQLLIEIDRWYRYTYEHHAEQSQPVFIRIRELERKLQELRKPQCSPDGISRDALLAAIAKLRTDERYCNKQLLALQDEQAKACDAAAALAANLHGCAPTAVGLDANALDCWRRLDARFQHLAARELYRGAYRRVYETVWKEASDRLQALKKRCEELTAAVATKRNECAALHEQLAAAQTALEFDTQHGPMRPPPELACSTLLHEICWLSLEDHEFNLTIPGQAAISQDYANAVDAIAKRLTPVWRPHTIYSIRLQVQDTVNGSPKPPVELYFGFRTAGPVGYFHADPAANYVKTGKSADEYLLTGLKGYIDYKRSYPNADGELIRAKPLFYEDARILLFFVKRYTYHFFGDWPAYNGLPALTGNEMQIVIKDPAEKTGVTNPPPPNVITTEIPQAIVEWPADDDPRIPNDVRKLLELRNPELLNPDFEGGECWTSGGNMIKPASVYTSVAPRHLRPLKLYTAIVNNVYKGGIAEVHRYVFQTSRYADFRTQVNSYHLEDDDGSVRDAIFRVDLPLTIAQVTLMYDIVSGNTAAAANAALAATWADPFDRLVEGVLTAPPMDTPVSTEFNIVRDSLGSPVALWIRNPEPFNDPKLPDDVLARTIRVIQGNLLSTTYRMLFSRDRSQAIVMHPAKYIPAPKLKFRFTYIEWNGVAYENRVVATTGSIPIGS